MTPRDVGEGSWTTDRRVLDVAPGPAALLVWRRTSTPAGGPRSRDELTPLRVDGWMQGYLLPAGDGGRVRLSSPRTGSIRPVSGLAACWLSAAVGGGDDGAPREAFASFDPSDHGHRKRGPVGVALASARAGGGCRAGWTGLRSWTAGRRPGSRRIGDPGAVGAVLVGTAALAAGLWASQQASRSGLSPTWCDAVAAVGVGLAAAVLLTRANKGPGPG